jgi:hypothetical protein
MRRIVGVHCSLIKSLFLTRGQSERVEAALHTKAHLMHFALTGLSVSRKRYESVMNSAMNSSIAPRRDAVGRRRR